MDELIESIVIWGKQRGLISEDSMSIAHKQVCKFLEEAGEMASAMNKNNYEKFKDGLGDTLVTLIILAHQMDTTPQECLYLAWNEIKDRTGRTIDGVFIKKDDLQ